MRVQSKVIGFLLGGLFALAAQAETLPDRRPALVGSGPKALVNLIDAETLFRKGQRDAWVMFHGWVSGDGIVWMSEFFTASPESDLLKDELRRRGRQTRFIPAVFNHRRVAAWFSGTVVFVVADGRPRVRLYAHQELDEIKRGADFIAPQPIFIPGVYKVGWPEYPSSAYHYRTGSVVKLRITVDAQGKLSDAQVTSERPLGQQFGETAQKAVRMLDYLPAYRNGQPTGATFSFVWVFGRVLRG